MPTPPIMPAGQIKDHPFPFANVLMLSMSAQTHPTDTTAPKTTNKTAAHLGVAGVQTVPQSLHCLSLKTRYPSCSTAVALELRLLHSGHGLGPRKPEAIMEIPIINDTMAIPPR